MENFNWWDDPKNKETFDLPISVINEDEYWVVSFTKETQLLLGEQMNHCAQGKTKEEAIDRLFAVVRFTNDYLEECGLSHQRWVPFRKGDWKHIGGKWIIIFGIQIYFRYGKGMKGGAYFPFTNLNVSVSSEWTAYKKYKAKKLNQ